jgi:hypothetical protein
MLRFVHIWPYQSLDERARFRDKAIADGLCGRRPAAQAISSLNKPTSFFPHHFRRCSNLH